MYNSQDYQYDDNQILVNDKDLPIDPEWEKQQKKTFTAWCNAHLRKINSQIELIEEDFRDGTKLMQLLEVISADSLLKPERGKLRFHQIANVNKALEFIGSKGVKLVSIGAEEIVDGNVKMTLGMIWTIILRFAIQNIQYDDISAKDGLLLWCQRQTSSYLNVNIQNFHTSFKDGLAFCALIHKHRPDLIEYSKLGRENPIKNLNVAFQVAEESLDIPRMLDPEDLAHSVKPDERSVLAYVSYYYHYFTNERQASLASNRIGKVVKMNLENDELRLAYESLSSDLIHWIDKKSKRFEEKDPQKSLSLIQELLEKLRDYRRYEKAEKFEEKSKLETTFNTLQTRLRLSNRTPFIPGSGRLLNDVNAAWKELEGLEKNYERWLLTELQRLQRIDHLNHKFLLKYERYMAWSAVKRDYLNETCIKSASVSELQAMKRKYEAFASDLLAHDSRVETISRIAEQLSSILSSEESTKLQGQMTKLSNDWQNLLEMSNNKRKDIEETLMIREKIDTLHLEYAKRAVPFNNWLEQATEDLQDNFIIQSNTEVKRLVDNHEEFHKSLETALSDFKEIQEIHFQVQDLADKNLLLSATDNPYTHVSATELTESWESVKKLDKVRTQLLSDAREKQMKNDELQKEFARLADIVEVALTKSLDTITDIAVQGQGTLENQLERLIKVRSRTLELKKDMDSLETLNQSLQDSFIFENSYTSLTLDQIRIKRDHLNTTLKMTVNQVENQILTRDSKGLTTSQMDDYRKCFNHFDRSKNGNLDAAEFKALLVSLEYDVREDAKSGDGDFARIMASVDPNNTGSISFEAFVDFMTKEVSDQDTIEQIVDSFRFLCGDKGYLSEDDIRRELPPDVADYCLKNMPKRGVSEEPKLTNGFTNGHSRNGFNSCSSRSETPQSCEGDDDDNNYSPSKNSVLFAYDFEKFSKMLFV